MTLLVKCLALWGKRERNGRHYSSQQTVQHSVQQPRRSVLLSRATRTGRGWIGSAAIASLGESWDKNPGALCWRLRSLGVSIVGLLFMSIT